LAVDNLPPKAALRALARDEASCVVVLFD